MKNAAVMILAAFALSVTVPAFAQMSKEEKNQCLLASKNCSTEVNSIQSKIKKLNAEIKKGTKVYTADEIKKLQDKLSEANDLLDVLLNKKGN
ncbi:hypothetical protein [Geobacter argillaceus]|uniref:Uncharacterized protein n=1 Tax=Geobacter argillaceus TaxID=345631 RepID=A0A562VIB4_9BACT|nr:hypothetical protein [Geobacter argillaceus]TWJ17561.1 hypothetical protein JN12_02956 [Geobacter argillaceus]